MALLTLPHFGARQATPAVHFDPDGELAAAQKRLLATNAYVTRRRAVEEAYRAACDAGVAFSDAPASFGLDTPNGVASASTQPLSSSQIEAARRLAHTPAAPSAPNAAAPVILGQPATTRVIAPHRAHERAFPAGPMGALDGRAPTPPQSAPNALYFRWRPVDAQRAPDLTVPGDAWAWRERANG